MVRQEDIERLINMRLNRLLLVIETVLPSNQFQAFRKITLNEFGNNGLGKDMERLFQEMQYKGR